MGSEKRRKGINSFRVFVGCVVAMVAAAVVGGLYLAGSPRSVRSQNFDNQRLNDLQQISNAIDAYFDTTNAVPTNLHDVTSSGKMQYAVNSFNDPETKVPYEYRVTGGSTYELCTMFALPTQKNAADGPAPSMPMRAPEPYGAIPQVDWTHSAGRHCFALDASAHLPPQLCGLTNPCAAGQTCAVLPGRRGTACVPQGKECLAAGCPGPCTIAESYPAQVRCSTVIPAK